MVRFHSYHGGDVGSIPTKTRKYSAERSRMSAMSAAFHEKRAHQYFNLYLKTQAKIDEIESAANKAAQGNAMAVGRIVLDPRTHGGFNYKSLCGARDAYVAAAQLSATMAVMILLQGRSPIPVQRVGVDEGI